MIDRKKIDSTADSIVKRGEYFLENVLTSLGKRIDIQNPYDLMLEIKKLGIKRLIDESAPTPDNDVIITDYAMYIATERR